MMTHSVATLPFWLSSGGIFIAWYLYIANTRLPEKIRQAAGPLYTILDRKYYIDELYSWLFVGGARTLGSALWKVGDVTVIDGFFVNGTARVVAGAATLMQPFSVRIYLPLCLHHDCWHFHTDEFMAVPLSETRSYPKSALLLACLKNKTELNMLFGLPLLSLIIWLPVVAGIGVLVIRAD